MHDHDPEMLMTKLIAAASGAIFGGALAVATGATAVGIALVAAIGAFFAWRAVAHVSR